MITSRTIWGVVLAVPTVFSLINCPAQAKRPDNPGGGSGGGGGGSGISVELVLLTPENTRSVAWAINDTNLAVGRADGVVGVWDANTSVPLFSPLVGDATEARDINANGEIVGWGPAGPMYWSSPTASPIELPLPTGWTAYPEAISRDGVVVAFAQGLGNEYAVAWHVQNGSAYGPVLLSQDAAVGDAASLGSGVNRIVGAARDADGTYVATAWDVLVESEGSPIVTRSTVLLPDTNSRAWAVTEAGDVAGILEDANPSTGFPGFPDTPFVIREGHLQQLPKGRQTPYGTAEDLNDTNVVGGIGNGGAAVDTAQWNSQNKLDGLTTDFFADSWSFSLAHGINSRGAIVGEGVIAGTDFSIAWLLRQPLAPTSAVPEPSTLLLAALATSALFLRRRLARLAR